jgi:predicted MFS family arabinose efflux permease
VDGAEPPAAGPRRSRLWGHRDFNLLWAGQTVSQFGSQVSAVALPLIAVISLGATPAQVGVLGFLARLPFLLYLFAGVWVDRVRRRPVLVATDLARGLVLLVVPAAAWLGVLRVEVLYATLFAVMTLSVWFDTAYMSYLPSIVAREELVDGNTRLEMSRSAAQIGGPGLGGVLVQAVGAPFAVIADAVSFVVSALLVGRIRAPEPAPERPADQAGVLAGITEGLRFVFGHPRLRLLVIAVGIGNLAWAVQMSLFILFASRTVGVPPAMIGLVLAAAGPGALAGTLLAGRSLRRVGLGPTLILALAVFGGAALLIPLAPAGRPALAAAMLAGAQFLQALAFQVSSINFVSLRQAISPAGLLGRVNATFRFVGLGVSPLGALAGGALATAVGTRPALLAAALGLLVSPPMLLASPVRHLREAPAPVTGPAG